MKKIPNPKPMDVDKTIQISVAIIHCPEFAPLSVKITYAKSLPEPGRNNMRS